MSRAKRVAVALSVFVVSLGAVDALAKGQLAPSGVTTSPSTGAPSWWEAVKNDILNKALCDPPTADQCLDVDYAATTCGGREKRSLKLVGTSRCDAFCPVNPTLAQCRDQDFVLSVCGHRETLAVSNKEAPIACSDEDPATPCPTTGGTCANLLTADFEALQSDQGSVLPAATPERVVVVPTEGQGTTGDPILDLLSPEENGYGDLGQTALVRVAPPSYARFESSGASSRYWTENTQDLVALIDPDTNTLTSNAARRLFFTSQRSAWNENGNAVESCREYVYEKYYDYTVFEDAIKGPGARARRVWETAYGPLDDRASIGTRGVAQETLCAALTPDADCDSIDIRQKDGTYLPLELRMPTRARPKNEFFATKVPGDEARAAALSKYDPVTGKYTYVLKLAGSVVIRTDRPLAVSAAAVGAPSGVTLLDDALHEALSNPPLIEENWTYHKEMGELFDESTDEFTEILDKYRDTFPPLLAQRAEIAAEIGQILKSFLPKIPDLAIEGAPFDPTIFETPYDENGLGSQVTLARVHDAIDSENESALGVFGLALPPAVTSTTLSGMTALAGVLASSTSTAAPGAGALMPMQGSVSSSVFNLSAISSDSAQSVANIVAPALGNGAVGSAQVRLQILFNALARVEGEIEAALTEAMSRGCLEPSTFTTCDWSPQRFVQRVADHFQVERERDFQRCKKYTGGESFADRGISAPKTGRFIPILGTTRVAYPPWSPSTQQVCDDGAYNESPTEVERYFGCYDTWMRQSLANLEDALVGANSIVDPTTGAITPAETDSDSQRTGDKVFGVGYAYHAYWQVDGLDSVRNGGDDDWCALRPRFDGNFRVDGRFLGGKFDLVDAEAYVTTVPGDPKKSRAYLELGGFEIIEAEASEGGIDPAKYNVIFEEYEGGIDQYFNFSQTFPVGPVWISVGGGIAGVYGARALGAAGALPDRSGNCAQGSLGIEGVFSPFFGFEGFATAGVDYLVVSAGVKITLTIVSLELPFTTQLRFEGSQKSTNPVRYDTRLVLENKLDVMLKILDGRVSAFVEICFILCESFEATIFSWDGPRFEANIFRSLFEIPMGVLVDFQEVISTEIGGQLP